MDSVDTHLSKKKDLLNLFDLSLGFAPSATNSNANAQVMKESINNALFLYASDAFEISQNLAELNTNL